MTTNAKINLVLALMSGVAIAAIVAVFMGLAWVSCSFRYARTDIEARWVFPGGCQVKFQDKWVPEDRYRVLP